VSHRNGAYFTIRIDPVGLPPELAARHAKWCEQLLRDQAPGGLEVGSVEFHGSRVSPRSQEYSRNARLALRRFALREREQRVAERESREREASRQAADQLRAAASLAGEDIEVL
jgi:hypothetical protein